MDKKNCILYVIQNVIYERYVAKNNILNFLGNGTHYEAYKHVYLLDTLPYQNRLFCKLKYNELVQSLRTQTSHENEIGSIQLSDLFFHVFYVYIYHL